jgi:hypothetical protein
MQWLAEPRAAAGWAAEGGLVSLHGSVTGYPAAYGAVPAQVRARTGTTYDLSDRLSGPLAGGDGSRGLSWVLQRFLADLGRRPSGGSAVSSALRRLRESAGPAR